ncbi:MAG: DUF4956 domain-containing protein [candidate division KSB1 bacterium]|nr:DUF4956 domain-containing protein [candidate division KSB1 bacterium]
MNPSNLLKVDLTPGQVTLSFLLAFALAFVWATVYRKTHSGVAYTRSFFLTLMLISPIVAMVMMAIGSNVALSLGLVGALSIIRFRTVVKDAKDMTFLFLSIGIGLCCGANAWMVAMIGTAMVSLITIVMSKIGHDRAASSDYILIFRSNQKEPWEALPPTAQDLISWKQLRGATDVDSGKEFEYTYNVRLASRTSPERIVSEFSRNGAVRQVTMIAPENHLDL